ncbi:MAG: hypothetical protein A2V77_02685 [Anaeromyxobacter sp. RBG_16_69_14]|nr:MAG: hypothetical protein A2V77_02685 [Anaeromyxobacter sp. RBG_16_69_14]
MAFFSATENRLPCRARRAPALTNSLPDCGALGLAAVAVTVAAARSPLAAGTRSTFRAPAAVQRSTDRVLTPNFAAAAAAP